MLDWLWNITFEQWEMVLGVIVLFFLVAGFMDGFDKWYKTPDKFKLNKLKNKLNGNPPPTGGPESMRPPINRPGMSNRPGGPMPGRSMPPRSGMMSDRRMSPGGNMMSDRRMPPGGGMRDRMPPRMPGASGMPPRMPGTDRRPPIGGPGQDRMNRPPRGPSRF